MDMSAIEPIHSSFGRGSTPFTERNMLVVVVKSFFKSLIGSGMAETRMYIHIQ